MKGIRRSFFDDVATMLASRVIVQIAGLITSIIVARVLGAEGRGLVAAILFVPQLILTIGAGVGSAAAMHIGQKTWPVSDIVQTVVFVASVSIVVGISFSLAWILVLWEEGYSPLLVATAVAIVPGSVLANYSAGIFLGTQKIPMYAVKSWGPGVGKLLLTVLFVALLGLGAEGAVAAIALSTAGVAGVLVWKLAHFASIKPRWHKDIASALTRTGFALSFMFLLMILIYRANILLIQQFGTLEQLGIYALGAMLAELLWQIPMVVSGILFAKSAAAKDGLEFSRKVVMLARMTFVLGCIVSVVIALLVPYVIVFLYGKEFGMSADVVRALLPGGVAVMVFKILRQDLSGRGKPWAALWIIIPMLVTTFAAGPFVIPKYGAVGAAHATSIIYVIGTIFLLQIYSRLTGIPVFEMLRFRRDDFVQVLDALHKKWKKWRTRRNAAPPTQPTPETN